MDERIFQAGFTVLELLVVIAIIGILASTVLVTHNISQKKLKTSTTQQDINQIYSSIIITQYIHNDVLKNITGNGCSDCVCRGIDDLSILPDDHQCILNWENVASKIRMPFGMRDGWGSPYLVDENEFEFPADPCRLDLLRSAGSDKTIGGGDDISVSIPFYSAQCK